MDPMQACNAVLSLQLLGDALSGDGHFCISWQSCHSFASCKSNISGIGGGEPKPQLYRRRDMYNNVRA